MDVKSPVIDEYIHLVGRPSIREFIGFVRRHRVHGARFERGPLIQEWQRANEHIRELEKTEKGLADDVEQSELPEDMREVADAELATAKWTAAWEGLNYRWRMVELDRLVVFQKTINLRFVREIQAELPLKPGNDDIVRVAVGKAWQAPPVRVTRSEEYTFLCVSHSNDVRILEIEAFDPALIQGYQPPGHASTVIGICVGYTANMLTAIQVRNRLILMNGSHRAFALKDLGVSHVPCLVLSLSREDEFDLKAPEAVKENRELYLRGARPPLFKDYFDPQLRSIVQASRTHHLVQLQIGFQKIALAAM